MTSPNSITLCFSGHREYSAGAEDAVRLTEAIESAYSDGYRIFISGMAPGFDLAAAEAVLKLRAEHSDVQLVCAVPFAKQSRDFSPDDAHRYNTILRLTNRIQVLSERWSSGVYYRRNDWMVERSSRLIAYYDSVTSEPSSGTRHTVRAALKNNLEIVNLFHHTDTLF